MRINPSPKNARDPGMPKSRPMLLAQSVHKPYLFTMLGAIDVTKPPNLLRFGSMDVTKPYKFVSFDPVTPVYSGGRDHTIDI